MKLSPFPVRDDVLDLAQKRVLSTRWASWFLDLFNAVNSRVDVVASLSLPSTTLNSAFGGADATIPTRAPLSAGLYRVSAHALVRSASNGTITGRSSFTVSALWTYSGVVSTRAVIITGAPNTDQEFLLTDSAAYGGQTLIKIDAGTTVQIRPNYAINHALATPDPTLTYDLDVVLERLL